MISLFHYIQTNSFVFACNLKRSLKTLNSFIDDFTAIYFLYFAHFCFFWVFFLVKLPKSFYK